MRALVSRFFSGPIRGTGAHARPTTTTAATTTAAAAKIPNRADIRRTLQQLASRQFVDGRTLTATVLGCHAIASEGIDWARFPMAHAPGGEAFRAQGSWGGVVRRDLGSARLNTRVAVFGDINFYLPPSAADTERLLGAFCHAVARNLAPSTCGPTSPHSRPEPNARPCAQPRVQANVQTNVQPRPRLRLQPRFDRWAAFMALELWLLQPFYDGNRRAARALALELLRASGDVTSAFPGEDTLASASLNAQCFGHLNQVLGALDLLGPNPPRVLETRHGVPIFDYRPKNHSMWKRYWAQLTAGLLERYAALSRSDVEDAPAVKSFAAHLVNHPTTVSRHLNGG